MSSTDNEIVDISQKNIATDGVNNHLDELTELPEPEKSDQSPHPKKFHGQTPTIVADMSRVKMMMCFSQPGQSKQKKNN